MVQINFGGLTFGVQSDGILGEVRMFALSVSGAVTKASLQARGWAICDGTTAAAQGITSPTITAATPNLENKFIRGSDDEASSGTGGSETHNHQWFESSNDTSWDENGGADRSMSITTYAAGSTGPWDMVAQPVDLYTSNTSTLPSYYELVFFIKVRI